MTRLLITLMIVVGIRGDAAAAGVPRPAEVFARITLGADRGLDGIREVANSVATGAGSVIEAGMLLKAAGLSPDGLDLTEPVHVLYVRGATAAGFVVAGKVGVAAALPSDAVVKKKWAVLGPPALTKIASRWVFATLTGKAPPELVAVLYPDSFLGAFDIPALRTQLVTSLGASGEAMGQMLDGLVGLATDTLSITVRFDANADRLAMVASVTPKSKSKLSTFVAAQRAADFTQLARLSDGPSDYLLGARLTAGPFRAGLLAMAQQLIAAGSAGSVQAYETLMTAMSGEMMLAGGGSVTTGMEARGLYGLLDPKAAERAMRDLHTAMAQSSTVSFGSVSTTTVAVPGSTSHDGVTIRATETKTTPAVGPAVQRLQFAVVDNYFAFVTDNDAPRTIDAARNKGTSLKLSSTQQALFELATQRQDSIAITIDLGAAVGSTNPLPAGSTVLLSVGFKKRAAQLCLALPTTVIKTLMGVP